MASFDIILKTRVGLHVDGEPSDFVSEYNGVIICEDEETGAVTKAGRVAARRVHATLARNAGEPLFDVCDCHSQELHVLHTLLYEPDTHFFNDEVASRFAVMGTDLLVIDYVVLDPKWRKLNLGLLAVRKLADLLGGGVGLVVSEIAPLRVDASKELRVPARWLPRHRTADEWKTATVRLRRYFRRMGFRRLARTPFYALSLTQIAPSAADLLGPNRESP